MRRLSLARIWTPEFYSRIARHYDRFSWLISPEGEKAQQKVLAGLDGGALLDVGCGTGALMLLAQGRGLVPYGLDLSPGMLAQARAKLPDACLARGSFYEIPFPDNSFDYVVETNALSGVDIIIERALAEMLRVCKMGGELRLADYAEPPARSWKHKLIETFGVAIGDYPYNYLRLFGALGYQPEVEILGGHDMYQFFRVVKGVGHGSARI